MSSHNHNLEIGNEDVAVEVSLRGHEPYYDQRVKLQSGTRVDRWRCRGADCQAVLLRYTSGGFDGAMLLRSCGPFRPVRRPKT